MHIRTNGWLFLLSALAAAGCSQEVEDGSPSGLRGDEPQVIFEAAYSETGYFRIYRDTSGNVAMSVTGAIGKDDSAAIGKLVDASFVTTFQKLRPGVATVPPELVALEKERKPFRTRPPEMSEPALPSGAEDQPSFMLNTCIIFDNLGGCGTLRPQVCPFAFNDSWVHVSLQDENQWLVPAFGDISFFWNERSVQVGHSLSHPTHHFNIYPVAPQSFGFHMWSSSEPIGAPIVGSSIQPPGDMGVTTHWRFAARTACL